MQKGFATLEVILMVMVIGILASIAVPRFNTVTAAANTAKIQADLSTIDTAIAIYYMEKGKYPTELKDLEDYLRGAKDDLKPPTGKCYVNTSTDPIDVPDDKYAIKQPAANSNDEARAILGNNDYTAEKFQRKQTT